MRRQVGVSVPSAALSKAILAQLAPPLPLPPSEFARRDVINRRRAAPAATRSDVRTRPPSFRRRQVAKWLLLTRRRRRRFGWVAHILSRAFLAAAPKKELAPAAELPKIEN